MSVFQGSRYEGSKFTAITGRDLIVRKFVHPRIGLAFEEVDPDWVVHTVIQGDELDDLAYRYTNRSARRGKFWWLIAEVNGILWPLSLVPGNGLVIPLRELSGRSV